MYLVVPPKPQPRFVPPMRRPVEPLVHSPKRVKAARVGGVGMVDDAVGECERAHARRLASVGGEVGAGHGRELACEPPESGVVPSSPNPLPRTPLLILTPSIELL